MDVDDYATGIIAAHEKQAIRRNRNASQQDHVIFYRKRGGATSGPIVLREAPSRDRMAKIEQLEIDPLNDRWASASTTAEGGFSILGNDDGLKRQALAELKKLH